MIIKDINCTRETPVIYGYRNKHIYGSGISLNPLLEGRQDTDYFKRVFLPQLLPLEDYDLIVVLFSGGKDSTACLLKLLELGVPKDKLELWHHDIDGGHPERRMDWPCTGSYVRAVAEALGIRLRISYRINGFFGELHRSEASAPIEWIEPESGDICRCKLSRQQRECLEIHEKYGDRAAEYLKPYDGRHMFPAKSADLDKRWCSERLKISVGNSVTANLEKTRSNAKILIVSGERRGESAGRARYNEMELDRSNATVRNNRLVHRWRACIDYTEKDVWEIIRRHRINPHPCYRLGWNRCSCAMCIFSTPRLYAGFNELFPKEFAALHQDEIRLQFTVDNKMDLYEYISGAQSCLVRDDVQALRSITTGEFSVDDVYVDDWEYPVGAFHGSDGGSC